jgi:glycosyltransferase involved in cell wall biosynthesis
MRSMKITVVICTYNRSGNLANTLSSFKALSPPQEASWDMVVVDNNSSDDTSAVVHDFIQSSGLACKYVFEKKQGLSNARNRGIAEATGDVVSFTDDDVIVDPRWLRNIEREFQDGDVTCIGGKIVPIWEGAQPGWLKGELLHFLALLDLGEEKVPLESPVIWGANLSVRAWVFPKYGLFDPTLGNIEGKLYGGEETTFVRTLLDHGERVLYCPDILVHHCIPRFRMKKSYFRKWVFDKGELKAIQMGEYRFRNVLGIPLYMIREAAESVFRYLWKQALSPGGAFGEQLILIQKFGMVSGRWKYRNTQTGT